jgi:hypothetical protein
MPECRTILGAAGSNTIGGSGGVGFTLSSGSLVNIGTILGGTGGIFEPLLAIKHDMSTLRLAKSRLLVARRGALPLLPRAQFSHSAPNERRLETKGGSLAAPSLS